MGTEKGSDMSITKVFDMFINNTKVVRKEMERHCYPGLVITVTEKTMRGIEQQLAEPVFYMIDNAVEDAVTAA